MASCQARQDQKSFRQQTLLFQPDCRKFCLECFKGCACSECGARPHCDEQGTIHANQATVRAAAEKDVMENGTVVVNRPGLRVDVPYVRQCWAITSSSVPEKQMLPRAFQNRRVIVYVHGFKQSDIRTIQVTQHLKERLAQEARESGEEEPLVVSFLWPAYSDCLSYAGARSNVHAAASRLQALLQALQRQCQRVVVMAHSLGAKVALHALSHAYEECEIDAPANLCAHLILLSSAVPANALSRRGLYPRSAVRAAEITVISSESDGVLSNFFALGETICSLMCQEDAVVAPKALGMVGLASAADHVNCLHVSISHNEYDALSVSDIRCCIADAIWGGSAVQESSHVDLASELDVFPL